VVVIGTGFAGQAAAIEAHDAGADVLMLEKASEHDQGGNSRVCGQGFVAPLPAIWDGYFEYLKMATAGQGYPVPDEWIRFYLEEGYKNIEWFEGLGAIVIDDSVAWGGMLGGGKWIPFFPQFPGADAVASAPTWYRIGGEYEGPGGDWYFLEDQITERGIKKMFETPAKKLVQNPVTKEILGVVAESGGKDIYIKAKKAVCVCNGGYEYDPDMIRDYVHIPEFLSYGTPYNTGDGIKMCMEAGADLRNMGAFAAPAYLGCKVPEYKSRMPFNTPTGGACIMVGANSKRFRDEYRQNKQGIQNKEVAGLEGACNGVGSIIENGAYVRDPYPMPIHMIFDEEARLSGKLFGFTWGTWSFMVEGYECSEDNSAELEMGWIVKADSIRELATKIGRDPDVLEDTVNKWNESCAAGKDLEFDTGDPNRVPYDRPKELLNPLADGPFYAVELFAACLNTQGGMWRDTEAQVLDKEHNPIPRLYAAGENGGLWNHLYQCMSNVGSDCFGCGRIAGQNAAAEEPWA